MLITMASSSWGRESAEQRMVNLLMALPPLKAINLPELVDVRILRADRPLSRTPVLYDPGIVIVCQGCKRGYLGHQVYLYDEQHYLAVSVPVPFILWKLKPPPARPLLAIYLHLDFQVAAEPMLQMDNHGCSAAAAPRKA